MVPGVRQPAVPFFCESKCDTHVDILVLNVEFCCLVGGPVKGMRDSGVGVIDVDMVIS